MQVVFSAPVLAVACDPRVGLQVLPRLEQAGVFPWLALMECEWPAPIGLVPRSPVRQAADEVRHQAVHSGALGVLRASPRSLP